MLTFKSLTTNDVDTWEKMLTLLLTFKLLVINAVDLVDLYMRICPWFRPSPTPTSSLLASVNSDAFGSLRKPTEGGGRERESVSICVHLWLERLKKNCSRSAARDFGVLARLERRNMPVRPVTERKQSQNPKEPLPHFPNRMATVSLKML